MSRYSADLRMQLARERNIHVDEQDVWLLQEFTWSVDDRGYAYTAYKGKPVKLHHCIIGLPIWQGDQIDHIDRNKLNNRRSNLRYASNHENRMNREDTLCAYLVYPVKGSGFVFRVKRNGVTHSEYFRTEAEAIAARNNWDALQELKHGPFDKSAHPTN